jgi:hypothetical protein
MRVPLAFTGAIQERGRNIQASAQFTSVLSHLSDVDATTSFFKAFRSSLESFCQISPREAAKSFAALARFLLGVRSDVVSSAMSTTLKVSLKRESPVDRTSATTYVRSRPGDERPSTIKARRAKRRPGRSLSVRGRDPACRLCRRTPPGPGEHAQLMAEICCPHVRYLALIELVHR